MNIERIFRLASAIGHGFVEVQIRTRECGDGDHKWIAKVALPGSASPSWICDCSGATPAEAVEGCERALAIRLKSRLDDAEHATRELRAALLSAEDCAGDREQEGT